MSTIYPALTYQDANAAIAWLVHVFGFEEQLVVRNDDGTVAHAELSCGPGIIMLGGPKPARGWRSPRELPGRHQSLYVTVDDVDGHYARAQAAGAEILWAPKDTDYGSREYAARDLDGHDWSLGTYRPEPGER
jgi:uncharacterized glyoxalase superfamily protein PhnB